MQRIAQFWKSGATGKLVVGCSSLFVILCLCGFLTLLLPKKSGEQTSQEPTATQVIAEAEPTDTPGPTNTPKPTETPKPTLTPEEELREAIEEALGDSNRDVERISEFEITDQVFVQWAINDNLTEDMLKGGAQLDVVEILQAVAKSEVEYDSVRVYGTFPLVDQYGNVEETEVVKAVYTLETIERINWDNFLFKNVYEIADSLKLHPTFQ